MKIAPVLFVFAVTFTLPPVAAWGALSHDAAGGIFSALPSRRAGKRANGGNKPPTLDDLAQVDLTPDPASLPRPTFEWDLKVPEDGLSFKCPKCGKEQTFYPHKMLDGDILTRVVFPGSPVKKRGDWWVGQCKSPLCGQPVLVMGRGMMIFPPVWPEAPDANIPESVRIDFGEALLCHTYHLPQAAVVMARRAVQSAAIEKGAPVGDNLIGQIAYLEKQGFVTPELRGALDVVRNYGNDGAHPKDRRVTREQAKGILEAVHDVLRIWFVRPAKDKQLQEERSAKRHG